MEGSRLNSRGSLALLFSSITKLKMLKYPVPFIRKYTLDLNDLNYPAKLDLPKETVP